jgi:hypothetical protein
MDFLENLVFTVVVFKGASLGPDDFRFDLKLAAYGVFLDRGGESGRWLPFHQKRMQRKSRAIFLKQVSGCNDR